MKKNKLLPFGLVLLSIFIGATAAGAPITSDNAIQSVLNWLSINPCPMNSSMDGSLKSCELFSNDEEQPLYFVIALNPVGIVITAADDRIEPIICFMPDAVEYDPTQENALTSLLNRDIAGRLNLVNDSSPDIRDTAKSINPATTNVLKNKQKWESLLNYNGKNKPKGLNAISDIRVDTFVKSQWNQKRVGGKPCYNYALEQRGYLNYPIGCGATALVQIIRYLQWPPGVFNNTFYTYTINGKSYSEQAIGIQVAYNWNDMPLVPTSSITDIQRQAIGTLCWNTAIMSGMAFGPTSSGTATSWMINAMKYSMYLNAALVYNSNTNPSTIFTAINAGLNAKLPSLLSIQGTVGHFVVCDGYGYDAGTMYHHLNIGWGGYCDMWYNLPDVGTSYHFDTLVSSVSNIWPFDSGEIISGRITDCLGNPISEVAVKAKSSQYELNTTTDLHGVYAIYPAKSKHKFKLTAQKQGYTFIERYITTGLSLSDPASPTVSQTGNIWGGRCDFIENAYPAGADNYDGGTGETTNPYQIRTPQQFQFFLTNYANWAECFAITANIDMSGIETVIDISPRIFAGSLVGNGHTIKGLEIKGNRNYLGIFQEIAASGIVKNINFDCTSCRIIDSGLYFEYAGIIAGANYGTISNCFINGVVIGNNYVGVIAGMNNGSITNCGAKCTIFGNEYVGGLAGKNSGTISMCLTDCLIYGCKQVGGITGINYYMVSNCYTLGELFLAELSSQFQDFGGIAGANYQSVFTSYSLCKLPQVLYAGGLVGFNSRPAKICSCVWNSQFSQTNIVGRGDPQDIDDCFDLTLTQMRQKSNFVSMNWSYYNTWKQFDGQFPVLHWQSLPGNFNDDGVVNSADFYIFVDQWLESGLCDVYPAGGDGAIDLMDFTVLSSNWLEVYN